MFTMRDALAHEGWLCQPDNVKAESLAPGGGREGGLPPSR
jgi:hypothetical protein